MVKKTKVKLNNEVMEIFGARMMCCGKPNWMSSIGSEWGSIWSCEICKKPLVVVSDLGKMYYVGEPIFMS